MGYGGVDDEKEERKREKERGTSDELDFGSCTKMEGRGKLGGMMND